MALRWADDVLRQDERAGLTRLPRRRAGGSGVGATVDGRSVVIFSSNDYLGLSVHEEVRHAAARAALDAGVGSTGSRHLSGNHEAIASLEARLCEFEHSESATLAPSGYHANVAILEALGGPDAIVFTDSGNHASIFDGCRASRSLVEVYRHRDLEHLESRLRRAQKRAVIVSDTVFSMDGTLADVSALASLARRYDAWLVLDEAHATGVRGPGGRGVAAESGIGSTNCAIARVVTFSKALGCAGGAIVGPMAVRRLLFQRGRALIYSTALAHPLVAAANAALALLAGCPELVEQLQSKARLLRDALGEAVLPGAPRDMPIVPVAAGDPARAVALEKALLEDGFLVQAVRPPSVRRGGSRLRLVVSVLHSDADVAAVARAVRVRAGQTLSAA